MNRDFGHNTHLCSSLTRHILKIPKILWEKRSFFGSRENSRTWRGSCSEEIWLNDGDRLESVWILRCTRIHHVDKVVVRNSFYPFLEHWNERSLRCWRRREHGKLNDAGSAASLRRKIYACEQWPAKRLFRALLLFSFQVFLTNLLFAQFNSLSEWSANTKGNCSPCAHAADNVWGMPTRKTKFPLFGDPILDHYSHPKFEWKFKLRMKVDYYRIVCPMNAFWAAATACVMFDIVRSTLIQTFDISQ